MRCAVASPLMMRETVYCESSSMAASSFSVIGLMGAFANVALRIIPRELHRVESRALHCGLHFSILHECGPDQTRSQVLRHHYRDALVDAKHICVIPVPRGMKRIDDAVTAPRFLAPFVAHRSKHRDAVIGKKRERPCRRTRHNRAIQWTLRWWTSPCRVAALIIRC